MSFWKEKIKFNKLEVPRFMVAPLDGITDSPMRRFIREFSPNELLFTEMRHVACVANEKEGKSLKFDEVERPLGYQFSVNSLDFIDIAVDKVLQKGVDMININLGCPARCVIKSGSGSALMADPERLKTILLHFKKRIPDDISFTIKIRSGFKEVNAVEISKLAEGCGVDGIIIHPRTQTQGFTGLPDTDLVRKVKESVNVPIVFSGNINSFKRAQKVYEKTGVDGFMIGRAVWGCPWKVKEITDAIDGKEFKMDSYSTIKHSVKHLKLNIEHYGRMGHNCFKKQMPVYIKSIENAAEIRKRLVMLKSGEEMLSELNALLENAKEAHTAHL